MGDIITLCIVISLLILFCYFLLISKHTGLILSLGRGLILLTGAVVVLFFLILSYVKDKFKDKLYTRRENV
jgi:hypothetical protein